MKKIYLCCCYFLLHYGFAQAPAIEWLRSYGSSGYDGVRDFKCTADGGFIVAGVNHLNDGDITDNHGEFDAWILKLAASGKIEWQKSYGGSLYDEAVSIVQTPDGGFVFAGYSNSLNGDVTGNHGNGQTDIWVVKLTINGTIEWQKSLGGTDEDYGYSIDNTLDGGFIVTGYTESVDGDIESNYGGRDIWVIKLEGNGTIDWERTFGGSQGDVGYVIRAISDGKYMMAGITNSDDHDAVDTHGGGDVLLSILNADGSTEWSRLIGGSSMDVVFSAEPTTDGGYFFGGTTMSQDADVLGTYNGSEDYWAVKTDAVGTIQWQKRMDGLGYDEIYAVAQTSDGGFVFSGWAYSTNGHFSENHGQGDALMVKLDSSGDIQWTHSIGGTETELLTKICIASDGSIVAAGYSSSSDGDFTQNFGSDDAFILKFFPESLARKDFDQVKLSIYPNPTAEKLHIDSIKNIESISVVDATGKMLLQQVGNTNTVDVGSLASGIYFLKVIAYKKASSIKFIKQ